MSETKQKEKYEEEINNIAFKNISDFGWMMIIEGIRMTESPYLMEKAWKYIDVISDKIIKETTKAKALAKQNNHQILRYSNTEIIELMKSLRVIHEVKMVYYAISGDCNEYRELEEKYNIQNNQNSQPNQQKQEVEEEPTKKSEKKPIEQYYETIIKTMHNVQESKTLELKTNYDKNIKVKIIRFKGKQVRKEGMDQTVENLRIEKEEMIKAIEQFQMAIFEKDMELNETKRELEKMKNQQKIVMNNSPMDSQFSKDENLINEGQCDNNEE